MSVSMTRADGVTVFTLTTDPQSACPPLCQIFKGLCYSPVLCSASPNLCKLQKNSQAVLGALQIMIGCLNIGLGAILSSSGAGSSWQMDCSGYPFWMGASFMFFGFINVSSGFVKFPNPCLVILNVLLNLVGVGFAIAAIILYSMNMADIYVWWMCDNDYYSSYSTRSPDPEWKEKCYEARSLIVMLLRSITAVLIVLSVLELCVGISSAVLGIKALRGAKSKDNGDAKSSGDSEGYKPLLNEVTCNPMA